VLLASLLSIVSCTEDSEALTREELLVPSTCAECHPDHYREWSSSMHAYATEDPVFQALNARGQRETDGELGDYCVRCHAPMAVREGLTTDGSNLDELPSHLRGVPCFFCHSVLDVEDFHDAQFVLADDGVLRGSLQEPQQTPAHASVFSPFQDRTRIQSADLCGSCHCVESPDHTVQLERTYREWYDTLYADQTYGRQQTCGMCHMQGRDGFAADVDGVSEVRVHSHLFPGVDVAVTDFPDRDVQLAAVQRALDTTVWSDLRVCVTPTETVIELTLENVAAGHSFPSGSAHDRRVWVELVARGGDEVRFETGVLAEDEPVPPWDDPDLWRLGNRFLDADGEEVIGMWEARATDARVLSGPAAATPVEPGWVETHFTRTWRLSDLDIDEVSARVLMRPIGLEILDELIASGDLDPSRLEATRTFDLAGAAQTWSLELDGDCTVE